MHRAGFHIEFRRWTLYLDLTLAVCKNLTARKQQMIWRWTNEIVQINFTEGINDSPHISPMDGARAHRARFGTGIKDAGRQFLRREVLTGKPHQIGFGMASTVTTSNYSILCSQHHLIIFIHQQRAERVITMFTGVSCDFNGSTQVVKVY
jgi:hypothetical protein